MKVVKSKILGFCMGVRRALDFAEKALSEYKGKKVYSLGPLIHNNIVLEDLESRGLKILLEDQLDILDEDSVVIVRAHGISPDVKSRLTDSKCIIVDATCPRVSVNQKKTDEFRRQDYMIILAGDKDHGEVKGIAGFAGNNFVLIQNQKEAADFISNNNVFPFKRAVLLSQTTFSPIEFENIRKILIEKNKDLIVLNTICPATDQRQKSLEELAPLVDSIVVVGGKKSANSLRLYEKAKQLCPESFFVESGSQACLLKLKGNTVGITAGASAPDYVIDEVEGILEGL